MTTKLSRRCAVAGIAALAAAGLPSGAGAGEIGDEAAAAEALLMEGKAPEALAAFERATAAFWDETPLQLRDAAFADAVEGYGQYRARADADFRAGNTATIYVAPVGYGFLTAGETLSLRLTAAVQIVTPGGLVLARADDFGDIAWRGRAPRREFHAAIGVPLPDLKAGDYALTLTITDSATTKSASVTLPFAIVE